MNVFRRVGEMFATEDSWRKQPFAPPIERWLPPNGVRGSLAGALLLKSVPDQVDGKSPTRRTDADLEVVAEATTVLTNNIGNHNAAG
jgi:hypothetical protein